MHVPATLLALACLAACILLLDLRWPRLGLSVQRLLLFFAVLCVLLSAGMVALGWSTVWPLVNSSIRWSAVAGYGLLLLRFTHLRPRWLTTLTAAVLFLPVFGASILLPLTYLFDPAPVQTSIAPGLLVLKSPWNAAGLGNSGTDLTLTRISRDLPFLRNQIITIRLYNSQCNTAAATATLDPASRTILVRCPQDAAHAADPPHDTLVHLR